MINKHLPTKIEEINKCAKAIEALADTERKNVQAAIPLVRKDSALGYEPSMDYVCDEEALMAKCRESAQKLWDAVNA